LKAISQNRFPHAHLIIGADGVGKTTLAIDLARTINCIGKLRPCGECKQCIRIVNGTHTDVKIIGPRDQFIDYEKSHSIIGIDEVRVIQRESNLKPFEGRYRVFIFGNTNLLSQEAGNSLLKILEEPPKQVIFMLLAADLTRLLPTIVSRCQKVELGFVPLALLAEEIGNRYKYKLEKTMDIARVSRGRPDHATEICENPELISDFSEQLGTIEDAFHSGFDERFIYADHLVSMYASNRSSAFREIRLCLDWWRDVLLIKEDAEELAVHFPSFEIQSHMATHLTSNQIIETIKCIQDSLIYLEQNVSPRLVMDNMMLSIPSPPNTNPKKSRENS